MKLINQIGPQQTQTPSKVTLQSSFTSLDFAVLEVPSQQIELTLYLEV
jgi:hypothetical protein